MKKIVSIILLLVSAGSLFVVKKYEVWPFDYHFANLLEFISLWLVVFFIISLFALGLPEKKYKIWFFISIPVVLLSLYWAYMVGDGNGAILSFDGEMITWFCVGIYSIVSFIFVLVNFLKNKKTI